jgi:glycosyltransferase involved in cell wall biosynthesis
MKRKVSIIIPVYNCENYISRCLDSILKQTYKNIEVIVVNDGSTDNTQKILDEYAKKHKEIKVYKQKNSGVSVARNNGIKKSTGYYMQFTDSDDYLEENMIESMVMSAEEQDSDIVICEYNHVYESTKKIEYISLKDYENTTFADLISDENTQYGGFPWNKLIKKECIEKYYNEEIGYYENLLFFLDNSSNFKKYSVVHKPLYNYFINSNSALHSKKYNIKRITSLVALEKVISIVDEKYKDFYKYHYISQYKWNVKEIAKNNIKYDYSKFTTIYKEYRKKLLKKNNLNLKMKIKFYIKLFL